MEDIYDNDESYCAGDSILTFKPIYPTGQEGPDDFQCRTIVQSQVNLLDLIVGQIVDKLRAKNLWDNTLLILQSDNVC